MDNQGNKQLDRSFFGQPHGLSTLFMTEMWERFSYYGMKAILIYYMYFSIAQGGLGMTKGLAASIMSIYGSLVYLSSVLGGFLSDRLWGSRKTVFYGGVLIMFGHICLSLPAGKIALFISICLITIGTGLLKPNVSEMVGTLYAPEDTRRDSGFTIFVFGINLGSLVAPIVVPAMWSAFNFHAGFSLAAIGMFFGLVSYWYGGKKYLSADSLYPDDPLEPGDAKKLSFRAGLGIIAFALIVLIMYVFGQFNIANFITLLSIIAILTPVAYFTVMLTSKKVTKHERSRVWAYVPLFIAAAIFWAIEEQGMVVLALFAQQQTNNTVHIFNWVIHINPANYQTLNPLFILIYTPIFATMWSKLGKKQPSSPAKFSIGMVITGFSYLLMVVPVAMFGAYAKVSPFWLVGSWAIVEIGELLISPIGLSVTTKLAPRAFQSSMMSMWFLADSAGQAVNSQIVKFYTPGNEVAYFTGNALVAIAAGIVLFFMIKPIKRLMEGVL
ncbi:dipeptide/tripeptide permease [Secundilactobacillus pentosiphilus]|uniref:Di-/tripeptide transporter n=1 Tax=Secundilactobacillus pentosiphilus TaxID=1714682 RepID=A0A1Z5ISX5_9LACO|nr:peptide MFS transporter [Secundilactobacillus pentosiphilus]GAX04692.1 dipeptide/tripeptide permease [Secundilactobacillus pentosiphilus]